MAVIIYCIGNFFLKKTVVDRDVALQNDVDRIVPIPFSNRVLDPHIDLSMGIRKTEMVSVCPMENIIRDYRPLPPS